MNPQPRLSKRGHTFVSSPEISPRFDKRSHYLISPKCEPRSLRKGQYTMKPGPIRFSCGTVPQARLSELL